MNETLLAVGAFGILLEIGQYRDFSDRPPRYWWVSLTVRRWQFFGSFAILPLDIGEL